MDLPAKLPPRNCSNLLLLIQSQPVQLPHGGHPMLWSPLPGDWSMVSSFKEHLFTSRLVSAESSTPAPSSATRLTRRQTAALGTHLWFMEKMTAVSRKKHMTKLAADMQLTEGQVRFKNMLLSSSKKSNGNSGGGMV